MLLYWYLDVGPETRGQGADADAYADRDAYNRSSHHSYAPSRSADRDVGADSHPMVPAHSHPYIISDTHSSPIRHRYTYPLSHGDAHTHAYGHPHGYPSADGNACANTDPDQHID
jgi:hypothetical protein